MTTSRTSLGIVERKFASGSANHSSSDIRVLQWNVLADGFSKSSPTENFCAVPPECLPWSFREKLIEDQFNVLDPDIICLEEVDKYKEFFHPNLSSKGYSGQFLQKSYLEANNVPHGVAMFFKTSKFDEIDSYAEYLHEETGKVGNQGFLVKILKHKETQKLFIVCVVHCKAKKDFHARRLAQTKSALNILDNILRKYENAAVVWCGDFNGEVTELFYKEIMESKIDFRSSYQSFDGCELGFTTWKIRPTYEEKHTIDYIMFTEKVLKVKDVLLLMPEKDVPESRFPSLNHPSDHVCLCVDFHFI